MHSYVKLLKTLLEKHSNPKQAPAMKKYMRDQFEYLGIKSPQLKLLLRQHINDHGKPSIEDLDLIIRELWSLPEREFQYAAMNLVEKLEKKLPPESILTVEHMLVNKSWWDTVDLVSHAAGHLFMIYPKVKAKYLPKWRKSKNIWLRRTAILFQLNYKENTDFNLLCKIISENLGSDEFFVNKAIGWALRQHARIDPKAVKAFVAATKELHPLSRREALKHLK